MEKTIKEIKPVAGRQIPAAINRMVTLLVLLLFMVAIALLGLWALVSLVRWGWTHPLF
jgi:hypothetical protein